MTHQPTPWIAGIPGSIMSVQPGASPVLQEGTHALFAARVMPRAFEERLAWKWGFNNGALLDESLERQRLFVESLHPSDDMALSEPQDRRTFAIRCLYDPQHQTHQLCLVGKVFAAGEQQAEQEALRLWQSVRAIFPYDYQIQPLTTQSAFEAGSGWSLLAEMARVKASHTLAEVRRFEGVLDTGSEQVYLLGSWQPSKYSNEQVWRALSGSETPVLFSVTLRPTVLYAFERFALSEMAGAARTSSETDHPALKREIDWAQPALTHRLSHWRYPYLMQVHLAAPQGINPYLPQMIGRALSHRENGSNSLSPAPQTIWPQDKGCLENAGRDLNLLEPLELTRPLDARFSRLRCMVDADEALAAFHFPFPPGKGLPELIFSSESG